MGHAFNQTIMDSLTRYHRMKGMNTAWIPGTDHAGIATQIVVERQLQAQGSAATTWAPRQSRRAKTLSPASGSGKNKAATPSPANASHGRQRGLGSVNTSPWTRSSHEVVIETFVRLYEQGLIYRGKRLVNWDPVLQSAVSDLEVESTESDGAMHYMCYPFANGPQTVDGEAWHDLVVPPRAPKP
jgi:valyl-tRNA synthetase